MTSTDSKLPPPPPLETVRENLAEGNSGSEYQAATTTSIKLQRPNENIIENQPQPRNLSTKGSIVYTDYGAANHTNYMSQGGQPRLQRIQKPLSDRHSFENKSQNNYIRRDNTQTNFGNEDWSFRREYRQRSSANPAVNGSSNRWGEHQTSYGADLGNSANSSSLQTSDHRFQQLENCDISSERYARGRRRHNGQTQGYSRFIHGNNSEVNRHSATYGPRDNSNMQASLSHPTFDVHQVQHWLFSRASSVLTEYNIQQACQSEENTIKDDTQTNKKIRWIEIPSYPQQQTGIDDWLQLFQQAFYEATLHANETLWQFQQKQQRAAPPLMYPGQQAVYATPAYSIVTADGLLYYDASSQPAPTAAPPYDFYNLQQQQVSSLQQMMLLMSNPNTTSTGVPVMLPSTAQAPPVIREVSQIQETV